MSKEAILDPLQEKLAKIKFAFLFQKICAVYNTPSATQDIVNEGIAHKIAREYNPVDGYLQRERNELTRELSGINFTSFFSYTKSSANKDKRVFFVLKTPQAFLTSRSSNQNSYIRYVLKKYCNILSAEKLSEIYHSLIPSQLTKIQVELKNAIYDEACMRSTLINRLSAIFDNKKVKQEVKIALHLKNLIAQTKFNIQNHKSNERNLEISFIKSCALK